MGHHHQEAHHEVHQQGAHHPDQIQAVEHQAGQTLQSCVNDARVLMSGGLNGMMKDAQKEWKEHPLQLVGEVALGAGIGFGVGALAVAASPFEAAALTVAGGAAACGLVYDQIANHAERNQKVMHALMDAAKPGQSEAQIQKDQRIIEEQLGADIFHGALALGSGGVGGAAGAMWKQASILAAKEAMNAEAAANARNFAPTINQMEHFIKGDGNALRNGLFNALPKQPSLKFEPNTRPPEIPQGLHHVVIEGHEGH